MGYIYISIYIYISLKEHTTHTPPPPWYQSRLSSLAINRDEWYLLHLYMNTYIHNTITKLSHKPERGRERERIYIWLQSLVFPSDPVPS